jgi:DprA winged helix domain
VRSLTDILEKLGASVTGDATGVPDWPGLEPGARAVMTALVDDELLSPGRLAAAADLPPAALDAALLDLELAGLIRRTTAGVQAVTLPGGPDLGGRPAPQAEPRGPPAAAHPTDRPTPARALERGGSGGDDDPR